MSQRRLRRVKRRVSLTTKFDSSTEQLSTLASLLNSKRKTTDANMPSVLAATAAVVISLACLANAQAPIYYCKDVGCSDCPVFNPTIPKDTGYCTLDPSNDGLAELYDDF
jgi:hypothetical protein